MTTPASARLENKMIDSCFCFVKKMMLNNWKKTPKIKKVESTRRYITVWQNWATERKVNKNNSNTTSTNSSVFIKAFTLRCWECNKQKKNLVHFLLYGRPDVSKFSPFANVSGLCSFENFQNIAFINHQVNSLFMKVLTDKNHMITLIFTH